MPKFFNLQASLPNNILINTLSFSIIDKSKGCPSEVNASNPRLSEMTSTDNRTLAISTPRNLQFGIGFVDLLSEFLIYSEIFLILYISKISCLGSYLDNCTHLAMSIRYGSLLNDQRILDKDVSDL